MKELWKHLDQFYSVFCVWISETLKPQEMILIIIRWLGLCLQPPWWQIYWSVCKCIFDLMLLQKFFESAEKNVTLMNALQEDKLVFFLHLLGIDTNGHSKKPHSEWELLVAVVLCGKCRGFSLRRCSVDGVYIWILYSAPSTVFMLERFTLCK